MAIAGHAVGNDGRKHAFKRGQHGHGEGGGDEGQNVFGVKVGDGEWRQAARNAAEAGADGFDGKVKEDADGSTEEHGNDGGGHASREARQHQQNGQRAETKPERGWIEAGPVRGKKLDAGKKLAGNGGGAEAEEVLDLGGGDQHGDAVGETDDDHAGNEADGGAEASESHDEENDSGHDGDHGKAGHAEAGDDAGNDDDKGAGGPTDLGARAAEGGDEEPGDHGRIEAGLRRDSGGDAEGHGKRQSDKTHRDSGEQVVEEHLARVGAQGQNRLGEIRIA